MGGKTTLQMDYSQGDDGACTSSSGDMFSQIIVDIDTIVTVLDSVVDAPKEREALKLQLSGFKDQISFLESEVKKQGSCDFRQSSLEISLTNLQRNVDLVARSLGIDPVWNPKAATSNKQHDPTTESRCIPVTLHCLGFKHKARKLVRASVGCKNLRAFSLR